MWPPGHFRSEDFPCRRVEHGPAIHQHHLFGFLRWKFRVHIEQTHQCQGEVIWGVPSGVRRPM